MKVNVCISCIASLQPYKYLNSKGMKYLLLSCDPFFIVLYINFFFNLIKVKRRLILTERCDVIDAHSLLCVLLAQQ